MKNKTQVLLLKNSTLWEKKDLKANHYKRFSHFTLFMLALLEPFTWRIYSAIPCTVKKFKTKQTLKEYVCSNRCMQRMEKESVESAAEKEQLIGSRGADMEKLQSLNDI